MYIRIQRGNKWGYYDPETNKSIECKFLRTCNFENGYAVVRDETYKSGVINTDGETVIPFVYDSIEIESVGLFRVYVNELSCLINLEHRLLDDNHNEFPGVLQKYSVIKQLSDDLYVVAKDGKLGAFQNDKEVVACEYYSISLLDRDLLIVNESDYGDNGLINLSGDIIIPLKYDVSLR